jgi:ribose transport system substrate-binding protein
MSMKKYIMRIPNMRKLKLLAFLTILLMLSCYQPKSEKPQILVSPKGLAVNFWLSVKAGAEQAGKDFNVNIIWKGPSVETDIAGQIAIVEDYINKKVDAIVLAACDAVSLIPAIDKARTAEIPVITIDSGVDSDIPLSFIATDNIAAAEKAADILAELLNGKGEIALIPFVPGAATSIMREQGFKKGLEKYPALKLVAIQYSQADVATAMTITENIVTAHPNLAGIFAANESGAIGAAQALISKGLAGKIKLVAFDAAPNEIEALKQGTIHALIVQNPFKMGYEGVKAAINVLNGKPIEKRIDTGVAIVTNENLNSPEIQQLLNPMEQKD